MRRTFSIGVAASAIALVALPVLAQGMMGYGDGDVLFRAAETGTEQISEERADELVDKMREGTLTAEEMDEVRDAMHGGNAAFLGADPMMFATTGDRAFGGSFDCPMHRGMFAMGTTGMGWNGYGHMWGSGSFSLTRALGAGFTLFLLWTFLGTGAWAFVAYARGKRK